MLQERIQPCTRDSLVLFLRPFVALLMLFLEWEVLDLGAANRKGGKSSASNDPNVLDGVSYVSLTLSSVAWTDEEDAALDTEKRAAIDGSAGRCVLMKVETEREMPACGRLIAAIMYFCLVQMSTERSVNSLLDGLSHRRQLQAPSSTHSRHDRQNPGGHD